MRLFKAGGVGLGPYAFAPTGEGHWSRMPDRRPRDPRRRLPAERGGGGEPGRAGDRARGAPGPRRRPLLGGRALRDGLRTRDRDGGPQRPPAWRCVRSSRAMGPVGASLPMRASALISDEDCDRIEARGRVESALELERALMNGAQSQGAMRARRLGRGRRPPPAARSRPRRARHRPRHGRRRVPDRHRPRRRRRRDHGQRSPRPRRACDRCDAERDRGFARRPRNRRRHPGRLPTRLQGLTRRPRTRSGGAGGLWRSPALARRRSRPDSLRGGRGPLAPP